MMLKPLAGCDCPQTRHVHGLRVTYVRHRCRCDDCREANRLHQHQLSRAHLYGRFDKYVPGDQVRAHVATLRAAGMGRRQIAQVAGVAESTLTSLLYGRVTPTGRRPPTARVRKEIAAAIMSVETPTLAPTAVIAAAGTHRRLQALVARGWSLNRLAKRLGWTRANLGQLLDRDAVIARTRAAVAALYEELWDLEPDAPTPALRRGVTRAKRMAQDRGWLPPMAWDDDTIDDPTARPHA